MLSSKPKHPCHSRFFVHELTNRQLIDHNRVATISQGYCEDEMSYSVENA